MIEQEQILRKCLCLNKVALLRKVFTKTECTKLIERALHNWTETEGMLYQSKEDFAEDFAEDFDYRNTTVFLPPPLPSPDEWIAERIAKTIVGFNNSDNGYGFHITELLEPPGLMRYQAPDIDKRGKPGKYGWHMDVDSEGVAPTRKLSYSILLNPNEYEGGNLIIKMGRIDQSTEERSRKSSDEELTGAMILFPSYILHKVAEVTKGTRYSLVGWAHGNSFI